MGKGQGKGCYRDNCVPAHGAVASVVQEKHAEVCFASYRRSEQAIRTCHDVREAFREARSASDRTWPQLPCGARGWVGAASSGNPLRMILSGSPAVCVSTVTIAGHDAGGCQSRPAVNYASPLLSDCSAGSDP